MAVFFSAPPTSPVTAGWDRYFFVNEGAGHREAQNWCFCELQQLLPALSTCCCDQAALALTAVCLHAGAVKWPGWKGAQPKH